MIMKVSPRGGSYNVIIERGCMHKLSGYVDALRKCLIVTDDGIPEHYVTGVSSQCRDALIVSLPSGEDSKSMANLELLLRSMMEEGFTRSDCVIAVGGGMAGDIAGFAAATYMRGIDFYNIPTTLLSQADSSIGGKTAVNLGGVKNIVGAFWQPKAVLIDPDTLKTLPDDQIASGMAEIIKSGMIADAELFEYIEENISCRPENDVAKAAEDAMPSDLYEELLRRSLAVKKHVVEEDEREGNLRRILNFGHTIGHGIESVTGMPHGHCVALGMIPMCSEQARMRLIPVLESAGLPTYVSCDLDDVYNAMLSDKKKIENKIAAVRVDEIGKCEIKETSPIELRKRMELLKGMK